MKDDNPFLTQGEAQTRRRTPSRATTRSLDPDFDAAPRSGNPFENLADVQMSGAAKAKGRARDRAEKRAEEKLRPPTPLELKRMEDAELAKLYRAWKREERAEMVEAHGKGMKELISLLRGLHASSFHDVFEYIRTCRWLLDADDQTKKFVLGAIDAAMVRANIRDGRPPLDDPLWDQPPSPWIKIRKLLTGY